MGKKIIKVVTNFLMVFIRNNFLNLNSFDMDTQIRLWKTTVEILKNGNSVKNEKVISSQMTYGRFLDYLDMGWVKQVDLYKNSRIAVIEASSPELGNRPQKIQVVIPMGASQLVHKLKENQINFDAHREFDKNIITKLISNVILPVLFLSSLIFFYQDSINLPGFPGSSSMGMSKSPARFDRKPQTNVNFNDIAGIDEAKAEFEEIVSFLNEPDRYTRVGAKIPKGILVVGPPGTGKTLLAKAIANEAQVPFFRISGSEFVEMFVGIGAARVRDLFRKAAENTPCIIFIDEIDAVGRERGGGMGGGNDEREQTLNQLLTEMDGFKENKGIIVIGATNRSDILDRALLRPGRFDRQIQIALPDRSGRIGILLVHAKNKKLSDDVSLIQLANRTQGFSGADLANILNEAAILTTRYGKLLITNNEMNEAIDRVLAGIPGSKVDNTKSKKLVAYYEVGKALVASLLKLHDDIEKVTIIPRGNKKGLTWFQPDEEQNLLSRSQLISRIIGNLGGRAAEQIIFGKLEITTSAVNELFQSTNLARQMVTSLGMSSLGPFGFENANNNRMSFMSESGPFYSKSTGTAQDRIDNEIIKMLKLSEHEATHILLLNRAVLDLIVDKLLETETIIGNEFRQLIATYTLLPNKKSIYKRTFNL
mmetsp:Transcript_7585/g.11687  ORF Transcript_7585/g.11687 Transcript_7585/m.11687 type:complete len:651 (+) Transcript_7585:105-2057(+)